MPCEPHTQRYPLHPPACMQTYTTAEGVRMTGRDYYKKFKGQTDGSPKKRKASRGKGGKAAWKKAPGGAKGGVKKYKGKGK